MTISVEQPYLLTIEEKEDGQYLYIKKAKIVVYGQSVMHACEKLEKYFGMGRDIKIIKCELLKSQ